MTDRDPRYTGGRIWGVVIIGLALVALALIASIAVTLYLTGAIQ